MGWLNYCMAPRLCVCANSLMAVGYGDAVKLLHIS